MQGLQNKVQNNPYLIRPACCIHLFFPRIPIRQFIDSWLFFNAHFSADNQEVLLIDKQAVADPNGINRCTAYWKSYRFDTPIKVTKYEIFFFS